MIEAVGPYLSAGGGLAAMVALLSTAIYRGLLRIQRAGRRQPFLPAPITVGDVAGQIELAVVAERLRVVEIKVSALDERTRQRGRRG